MKVQKHLQRLTKIVEKQKKIINYRKNTEKLLTKQKPSQPLFLLYKHYSEKMKKKLLPSKIKKPL